MGDNHSELAKKVEERRKLEEHRYQEGSKKRLMNSLERKFKTTMIGSLARFERVFGYLWAHNVKGRALTNEERKAKELWDEVRNDILDNGHAQLRGAQQEITQYDMKFNRYRTEFLTKQEE